jgi:thiamine biosynthesis lipoprotein|tara:strand:- start:128846 stop:129733 length:888 start_codon:yes stop_codon:yes gene_type:complete
MGTGWRIRAVVPHAADAERLRAPVEAVFSAVISEMSQWDPMSELSRFNRAPGGTWHAISPGFLAVIDCALLIAGASDGAFDPAMGQATDYWGFGAASAPSGVPMRAPVVPAHGWRDIRLDRGKTRLWQPGGVHLDLSGIAKGYAVDDALATLGQLGIDSALVEIGGELAASGVKPDGMPWWVDLDPIPGLATRPTRLGLCSWSVATSGDWQRRRDSGADSWSHTLSPAYRAPLRGGSRSATVLHRACMQADALATVMMVMPPDRALDFANRHDLPVRIVTAAGEVRESAAWRQFG